jgi:hypothetical protein
MHSHDKIKKEKTKKTKKRISFFFRCLCMCLCVLQHLCVCTMMHSFFWYAPLITLSCYVQLIVQVSWFFSMHIYLQLLGSLHLRRIYREVGKHVLIHGTKVCCEFYEWVVILRVHFRLVCKKIRLSKLKKIIYY